MKKLPWAEGYTAEELISRLKTDARHLLKDRGPEFVADWRRRAGFTENREEYLTDTPQNRTLFNEQYATKSLMTAIRFKGAWSAGWMELAAGMAQWAMAALVEIRDLEIEIEKRRVDGINRETELLERIQKLEANAKIDDERKRSLLDHTRDQDDAIRKVNIQLSATKEELRLSQEQVLMASERAHQWEAVAATATRSAEAAATAINLLKEVYMAGKNAGDPKPDDNVIVRR